MAQCADSAPFAEGEYFVPFFRIGEAKLSLTGYTLLGGPIFYSLSVYQPSVYLAPGADKDASLLTSSQVGHSSLPLIHTPKPHTNQHQPPPDSTKRIIAVVRVLTADLSGLYVFNFLSPGEM